MGDANGFTTQSACLAWCDVLSAPFRPEIRERQDDNGKRQSLVTGTR